MKATCYHLRNQEGVKVLGGSIGLSGDGTDLNAAAAQITGWYDIIVLPSGRLSYAKDGKPVYVYLSVEPSETDKGRAVLKAHRLEREAADRLAAERDAAREDALNEAINAVGVDRALELLKSEIKKSD